MTLAKLSTAFGHKLRKFLNKEYRDGYLETHVRSGIAYQIRALREKGEMSQDQFAEATGKKQSTVSRLENTEYGKVSVQTLLDIARAMNVGLLVRFVDYPQFLRTAADMSPRALAPDNIFDSVEKADASARRKTLAELFSGISDSPRQDVDAQNPARIFVRAEIGSTSPICPPYWRAGEKIGTPPIPAGMPN